MSRRLSERLRDVRTPHEAEAEERSWQVVRGAYAEREPRRRRARRPRSLAAGALVVLVAALAVTPVGTAVARWLRHTLAGPVGAAHSRPALAGLPAAGRLLVDSQVGPWVVEQNGARRRLGPYAAASWSPRGLFAVATGRNAVVALDPRGAPRWALARPNVAQARWSPGDGFRVAYLSGRSLRLVNGDGTGDRLLAGTVSPLAPAWRPGAGHVLAYGRGHRVVVQDVDTRRILGRLPAPERPRLLVWSPTGSRLLVLGSDGAKTFDARGRVGQQLRAPRGGRLRDAAYSPDGTGIAVIRSSATPPTSEVVLWRGGRTRRLFTGAGGLGQVEWSPNSRWLLITWPAADQWVFLRPGDHPRILAVSHIAGQFDPAHAAHARVPRLAGWCCGG